MSKEFKVPQLGENVEAATVAKVLVSKGDSVKNDQAVVELETDKAVTEVPCDIAGTVAQLNVKEGDEVKVGQVLLTLEDEEAGGASSPEDSTAANGEEETGSGGQDTGGGKPDKQREQQDKQEEEDKQEKSEPARSSQDRSESEPLPAAPTVRRFAREIGVDLAQVHGSGPHDRISIEDVKAHARARHGRAGDRPTEDLPDFSQWGEVERKAMSKVRRLTAEHMSRAWAIVPQATQFGKADVTETERLRQRYKQEAKEAGGHLSLTVILLKTVAAALKQFPRFNASVDSRSNEIVYKKYVNVGLAMDTERGLLVPVIRDVDRKNVIELSVELTALTAKAREGKLAVSDMRGGNMTITNAGALGGDTFVPIVNWPEAAILGVAQRRMEAVLQGGEFKPRQLLPLALSFDHRIIDGADGVRFMRWIIEALEDPVKLAWEG